MNINNFSLFLDSTLSSVISPNSGSVIGSTFNSIISSISSCIINSALDFITGLVLGSVTSPTPDFFTNPAFNYITGSALSIIIVYINFMIINLTKSNYSYTKQVMAKDFINFK